MEECRDENCNKERMEIKRNVYIYDFWVGLFKDNIKGVCSMVSELGVQPAKATQDSYEQVSVPWRVYALEMGRKCSVTSIIYLVRYGN